MFQKEDKHVRRQVYPSESKFFEKGNDVFPPISCQTQPPKASLRNSCSTLVVKNRLFLCSTFQLRLYANISVFNISNESKVTILNTHPSLKFHANVTRHAVMLDQKNGANFCSIFL